MATTGGPDTTVPSGRVPRFAGAALFGGVVLVYAAFAWDAGEKAVLAAAAEEGRALVSTVSAGLAASLDASRAVEDLVAARALDDLGAVAENLAASPDREETVLSEAIARHRWSGALLLDGDCGVVLSVDGPGAVPDPAIAGVISSDRVVRLRDDDVAKRLSDAALATEGTAVLRFGAALFAPRTELVAARRIPGGGFVAARIPAGDLDAFERSAGVARLLRDCAQSPGVAGLAIQTEDGRVVAAGDPALVGTRLPPPSAEPAWTVAADGRRTFDIALPVPWEGPPRGWLRVALAAAPVEDVVGRTRGTVAVLSALAWIGGAGALAVAARVERRRRDEAARLLAEIDRRERFASLGRMAGGVAHEIRGPLNAIGLAAQMLGREAPPPDPERRARFDEHIAALRGAVRRVDAVVGEFLALGRGGRTEELRETDVADVVGDALATEGGAVRVVAPDAPVRVVADRALLARALANLVRNARQAGPPDAVGVAWRREASGVVIDVTDGGPGVAAADRERIFEPFFSTRRGGTGLGLVLAREAAERHGGTLAVVPDGDGAAPRGGGRFRITLPAAGAGARP